MRNFLFLFFFLVMIMSKKILNVIQERNSIITTTEYAKVQTQKMPFLYIGTVSLLED